MISGEPWINVSLSKDGRRGSVGCVIPGQSPCAECAQMIPESLMPNVSSPHIPVGDALKLVVALTSQHVIKGLVTGKFENLYHLVASDQPGGCTVSSSNPKADSRCPNEACKELADPSLMQVAEINANTSYRL